MPITPCPTAADMKISPAGLNEAIAAAVMEMNTYKITNEKRRGTLFKPNYETPAMGSKQFHKAELPVISENLLLTLTVGGDE